MLTTPRIKPFMSALDSTELIIVTFDASGGDQVFANEIEIYNSSTNVLVYTNKVTSFQFKNEIPINTLLNGTTYKVRIRTYNSTNEVSQWSDYIILKCLSNPIVAITNIGVDGIIKNQTYEFQGSFTQGENDTLKSYNFILYDSQHRQISVSGNKTDGLLKYSFTFVNDTNYFIEMKTKSNSDVENTTGLIPIYVKYVTNKMKNILSLTNDKNNATVNIEANIIHVVFKLQSGSYTYIDNDWIDLKDAVIYADNTLDYMLSGSLWTLELRFKIYDDTTRFFKMVDVKGNYLVFERDRDRIFIRLYDKDNYLILETWEDISIVTLNSIVELWFQKIGTGFKNKITII